MGLTNNLGKLSNMITSTGTAVGIAQVSPSYTLDVTGTGRFTSQVYVSTSGTDNQLGLVGTAPSLRLTNAISSASINGFVAMSGANNNYIQGSVSGDMCIGNQNNGKILFGFGSGTATLKMTLDSAGAVTFTGALSGTTATFSSLTSGYITRAGTNGLLQNSLIYDTGTRIAIGGTSATYGVLTVQSDAGQFCVQSNTTPGKQLQIGYDHTTNNSYLTSLNQGVEFTPLFLQPNGGTVGIGGLIANSGDRSLLSIKQTSTAYNNGIYIERGGERNGYFMYIGGSSDSLTFRRNYFGTQSDVLSLTRDGNVLIGATTSDSYSGYSVMQVGGNTAGLFQTFDGTVKTAVVSNNTGTGLVGTRTNHPLVLITNDSEKLRITTGGGVLIGTTIVTNANTILGTRQDFNGDVYNEFTNASTGGSARYRLDFITSSAFTAFIQYGTNNSSGQFLIYNTGQRVTIVAGASNGVYLASGATAWTSNSDERLKNINGSIDNALESLSTLRTIKYSWKAGPTNKESLGLIAQDVEKVFPQIIDKNYLATDDKGTNDGIEYLGVRYQELVPVLVKAIQELKQEIDELKNK